jgi:alcohol dehydrogenase (NADP+)
MKNTKAYAAYAANEDLKPFDFDRREVLANDVQIQIMYCGVCHSDLHQAKAEWGGGIFPMVPGHEIVGKVTNIGSATTKFKVGDLVGVGVFVDSCKTCQNCNDGWENYCKEGMTATYNSMERDGVTVAYGGYSTQIVVNENYVLSVSDKLDAKAVAPLLCAGITTYSPLKYANVTQGTKVGIIGLGGLGHMGVKFAVSFGAEVTVLSTSPHKQSDAMQLGAHHFLLTTDKEQMKKYNSYFDVLIDAVSANHDFSAYLNLLNFNGKLMVVGLPVEQPKVSPFSLITNRRSIVGSSIGGITETQEMLDYCAEHNIVSDVELIKMEDINTAYERMLNNDVKYRFVIDNTSI